jgi:hypothetical protein
MANKHPKEKAGKGRANSGARKTAAKKPAANGLTPEVVAEESQPPSLLRGILPPPPEIQILVDREVAQRPMSDEARQWVADELTLQYYFGGHDIAYRETREGKEVLAVGLEEIGRLLKSLPAAKRQGIVLGHPEPW